MSHKFVRSLLFLGITFLLSIMFSATTNAATYSGTIYSDAGITTMPDGATIHLLLNGAEVEGGTTDVLASGDGTYSFSTAPTVVGPDQVVTIYLDSGNGVSGITVTLSTGADSDITNLDIYQDHLIATHEGATYLTTTHMETGIPQSLTSVDSDVSNLIANNGTTLTMASGKNLFIKSGKTLNINEVLTLFHHVKAEGTLSASTTFYINGDITVGAAGNIISSVASNIYITGTADQNVTINAAGGVTGTNTTFLIDKASGILELQTTADLNSAKVRLDNGTISTNDNDITTVHTLINNGIFNLEAGTLDITSSVGGNCLEINDGTFNSNTGDLTCTSDIHLLGGDFNHGSGTVNTSTTGNLEINDVASTYTGTTGSLSTRSINVLDGSFIAPDTVGISSSIFINAGITFDANDSTITKTGGTDTSISGSATALTLHNVSFNRTTNLNNVDLSITGNLELTDNLGIINSSGTGTLSFTGGSTKTLTTTAGSQGNIDVNVTIDKASGTLQLINNIQLDEAGQTLVIDQGTLDLNGNDLDVDTSITVNAGATTTGISLDGDETVSIVPTFNAASRVTYTGAAGPYTVQDWAYGHLFFTANATFNLPDDLVTLGDLLLTNATSTVVSPATDITIGGDFDNSGTFTATAQTMTVNGDINGGIIHNNGTVVLGGTNNTISSSFTFYNLTKLDDTANDTSETVTIASGTTQTISNTLLFQGTDSDDTVILVSNNPGTIWSIDPQGTSTVEYVNVTDSTNIDTSNLQCYTGCTDGGNNTLWLFIAPVTNNGSGGGYIPPAYVPPTGDPIPTPIDPLASFTDLEGHWALEYITDLYEREIMTGRSETEFAPDAKMTRAEFIKVALLAYNYTIEADAPAKALELGFDDLTEGEWHLKYMYTAHNNGLVIGFPQDNTLRPNAEISRAEVLTIISRINDWDLNTLDPTITFPDVSETDWFYSVILKAAELNIVTGYETGEFGPLDNLLRAQAAKIISNLIST